MRGAPTFSAWDKNIRQASWKLFCATRNQRERVLKHVRTLYLDDLCVESQVRGQGTGHLLIEAVKNEAKSLGCYNLTLNVWACNPRARSFYETCGFKPMKTCMEIVTD